MDPDIEPSPLTLIPADILQQVLNRLSFSEFLSLRIVCKKWNAMVCSLYFPLNYHISKCIPVHFLNDKLTVYNSRTQAWEEHSLRFFQDCIQSDRLELVASAGGLMCFEIDQPNHLVVCNPISKQWKFLKVPVADHPSDPCRSETLTCGSHLVDEDHQHTSPFRKRTTIVGLVVDPVTGNNYSIVVAYLQKSTSSTVVYDSLTGLWKRGGKAPQGGEFLDGDATICKGSLYCLVKTESFNGEIFKYDVRNGRWSSLPLDMSIMRCRLIEHCGRVLLVERTSYCSQASAFRFYQLRDNSQRDSQLRTKNPVSNSTDGDLAKQSLYEIDLIEGSRLDALTISKVLEHLTDTGRVCVLGQKSYLYVLKPPYEDGLRKQRTLVTIIDLSTGSCDVLPEMIVASTAYDTDGAAASEKQRTENVFHLFSASCTVQV
jgi:hypothetical protein